MTPAERKIQRELDRAVRLARHDGVVVSTEQLRQIGKVCRQAWADRAAQRVIEEWRDV